MKILFKYPTMGRPDWFKQTLQTYKNKMSGKHEYEFVVSLNEDDCSMQEDDVVKFMDEFENLKYYYGNHKSKIEAVNADMKDRDFDVLVLVSDDMIPEVDGFDDIICQDMLRDFPDTDGALHYDDGFNGKDRTITLSIMGKKLYDLFDYIYCPEYKQLYCDNEFTDVVYHLGKVKYYDRVIIRHDWKGHGATRDYVYKRNSLAEQHDKDVYESRIKKGIVKQRKV